MNPNSFKPLPVLSTDEIREMLVKRIDQQKQAAGIVVGVIEPNGRRVVVYGNLAKGDPRPVDGDTIFEIGSISKVFTSLLLADMVKRKEVTLDDPAAKYLPEHVRMPERSGRAITLLDLSTHSSGLPRVPGNLNPKDPTNPTCASLHAAPTGARHRIMTRSHAVLHLGEAREPGDNLFTQPIGQRGDLRARADRLEGEHGDPETFIGARGA
jgi:CubicO group peptidase (beta-lactamase class C family)